MTYDQWKARELDDLYDDPPEEECLHEEYEIDWSGMAGCDRCGHTWEATAEQIKADRLRNEAYYEHLRREERRERLVRWFGWMRLWRWRKSKPKAADIDDEVPF